MLVDVRRQLGGDTAVVYLLLVERRALEHDERRAVDVDVEEAGRERLLDERAERGELLLAVALVIGRRAHLEVIALNEERAAKVLADGGGDHRRGVFGRPLLGVADLGPCDLEDDRRRVELLRRTARRARYVVGERPNVDRRHREPTAFSAAARPIERQNRRRRDADRFTRLAQEPATGIADFGFLGEDRVACERLRDIRPQARRILDGHRARAIDLHDALNRAP